MQRREFADADGILWRVWCVTPESSSGDEEACPEQWLVFESMTHSRRLGRFPDDWLTLPEAKLIELWQQAEASPVRSQRESTDEFTARQDAMFHEAPPPEGEDGRSFIAPDNQVWIVAECPTTSGAGHVLRFTCGAAIRELDSFPTEWASLPPGRLMQLALDARSLGRRHAPPPS